MRSRLLAATGAVVLALGGALVASASPAAADDAQCYGYNTHPDLHHSGGIAFENGTAIRRGPFNVCDALGRGYATHGIDVYCYIRNSNGVYWDYVRDTTTGVAGWAAQSALTISSTAIANCYN
jgi:hypothetical protein